MMAARWTPPHDRGGLRRGGLGNSQAEKPWAILMQPYLGGRTVGFCPSDPTPRSKTWRGARRNTTAGSRSAPCHHPSNSELAVALKQHLTLQSYSLNSIFTHKSARYAVRRGSLRVRTEALVSSLPIPISSCFSERNSEA
jgi:hypothetical protein